MEWSNEVTLEFLDLYENEPAIWNAMHPLHKNRNAVYDAWQRIQQQLGIESSIPDLKKKKESLMARFRQCQAKVKNTSKTGTGTATVYKPIWFAYDKMAKFLKNKDEPKKTINSQNTDPEENNDESEDVENVDENPDVSPDDVDTSEISETATSEDTFKAPPYKKRKLRTSDNSKLENQMNEAYNILIKKFSTQQKINEVDECGLYGNLIATKLRKLDEVTRDNVMHQIDNLLFNAKRSCNNTLNYGRFQQQQNRQFTPIYYNTNEQQPFQNEPNQILAPFSSPTWIPSSGQSSNQSTIITPVPSPSPSSSEAGSARSCYENFFKDTYSS